MPEPVVFDGYRPGAIAGVVGLHARYYARDWGFGLAFEAKVAGEMSEFAQRMVAGTDLFVTAWRGGDLLGSVTLDATGGGPLGAHLRWFIVSDAARGSGLGAMLLDRAIGHVDATTGQTVWLTTFAGLEPARRLYERSGFQLESESNVDQWQGGVREQMFMRPGASGRMR